VPQAVWDRWQRWLADETFWPEGSVLIHGDLHPAHILVKPDNRVTGLLDWTEAHVGDAATDFILQFATLGYGWLRTVLELYGQAGGRVWPRMHDHIVEMWSAYASVVADFARITGIDAHRALGQSLVDAAALDTAQQ
jgi:macrolide phosphotransferase